MIRMCLQQAKRKILLRFNASLRQYSKNHNGDLSSHSSSVKNPSGNCKNTSKIRYLEIYLIYPFMKNKSELRGDLNSFFENKLNNLENMVSNQPIFLDRRHALWHGRFKGKNFAIIKAYVDEHAIVGGDQMLLLKQGHIRKDLVHGFIPSWMQADTYFSNPKFNQAILV